MSTDDSPRTVTMKYHRTIKGTWLVSTTWEKDGVKRCVVLEAPDPLFFDAVETSSRLLKSDAFGKRNNAEELFPGPLRGD